jgi:hypothetical protein
VLAQHPASGFDLFPMGPLDDDALDAVREQRPMQPEPVATRFVAASHGRIGCQLESTFGQGDLLQQSDQVTGGDRSDAWRSRTRDPERKFPTRATEIESQEQHV